uniref:RING-type domain-containing protein n=1 Tax=Ciona savignyi TaxID=51511 RepID=H2ZML3_CIOSA
KSFLNWHENALDKKALARSGFFYLGNRDRTQCFNCMGVLKNWRPGDDINTIHSESFPTCSLNPGVATGTSRKGTFDFDDYLTESDRNLFREMFPCIDPKRPSMKFYEDRISSFEGKWTHSGPPTISDIAKAGFFLFDVDASVRCWYCDVVVSDVSRQWSPWEEHAKQYPSCHFLLRNRGHNFVEAALSSVTDNEPEPALTLFSSRAEFIKGMGSEIVANVVEMGFDPKFIKKVIRRQIRDHSTCFATTDALLDALLHPSEQESQGAEANRSSDEHSTPEAQVADENHRAAELSPEEERRVQSELRRLRDEKRCKVCLDRDAEMVFIPCGHLSTCLICTQSLRQCPVCRMKINRSYRTFPS